MKKLKLLMTLVGSMLSMSYSNAQCSISGGLLTENYNVPASWTISDFLGGPTVATGCGQASNGSMNVSANSMNFVTGKGALELRSYKTIPTLSNTNWTAEFQLTVSTNPSGGLTTNSPSIYAAAFTAGNQPIRTSCAAISGGYPGTCGTYPSTIMDGIWVLMSSTPPTSCTSGLGVISLIAQSRNGNGAISSATPINIAGIGTYFLRLERISSTTGQLSVYSNANHSTLIGSTCFSIDAGILDLNTLQHGVVEQGSADRVFNGSVSNMRIDNSNPCTATLASNFTAPSQICAGTSINVNGSLSTGSIANHYWEIVESTSTGTPIVGGYQWNAWYAGAPSNFTIPNSNTLACGKWYKIKLAVQNSCIPWVESSRLVYVNCPPTIKFKGSTSSICLGNSAILNASLSNGGNPANYTLTWTQTNPVGPVVYSGPFASVIVNPTVTTTYTATVTDNLTGCSTTQSFTVTVTNNDPSFSLTVNTANNSFFTLSALANNQSASSIPGFGFAWFVEELDPSNNVLFTFTNPSCWWQALNIPTVFNGIDCFTNTYSGASTIANCAIPPVGQFLYGHKYRITRGVWSDLCPWSQTSITVTPVKTQNGIELVEDHTAPDFSGSLTTGNVTIDNSISIYPNPSEGVFTIDLSDFENAQIEIYSVFGQKVKTITQKQAKEAIDLTGCSKGIYWVKITSNGVENRSKIILE
jgi:Secretion system C-terminal sorting domain